MNEGMSDGASTSSPLHAGSRGRGPPDSIADAAYVNAFLAENVLDAEELGAILYQISPEYTFGWFEGQQRRHIHAVEQDGLFAMMKRLSQCDECGKVVVDRTMLTCSACRGYHYCDRACQKLNWPKHKPVCRDQVSKNSYRVVDICSKMMTAMSMADDGTGTNTPRTNGGGNHIATCIDQHENTEFVYAAVYEQGSIMFIPMPENVLRLMNHTDDKGEAEKIDLMLSEKNIIVLIVAISTTDPDGVSNCLLLTKKTWVTTTPAP